MKPIKSLGKGGLKNSWGGFLAPTNGEKRGGDSYRVYHGLPHELSDLDDLDDITKPRSNNQQSPTMD